MAYDYERYAKKTWIDYTLEIGVRIACWVITGALVLMLTAQIWQS